MGFFDIDGKRYWDIRDNSKLFLPPKPIGLLAIPSDSLYRQDANQLKAGNVPVA
jgi:hypothetical protein